MVAIFDGWTISGMEIQAEPADVGKLLPKGP